MITSTSINAAFIAKLVHAANVAIACKSYCEVVTSKGKPSVLVEFMPNGQNSPLRFTHISGQDVSAICWQAIKHLVCLPSVKLVPVAQIMEQEDTETSSYWLIQAFLLFVMLGILVSTGVFSYGSALLAGGFAVMSYRLLSLLDITSYTGSAGAYRADMAQ